MKRILSTTLACLLWCQVAHPQVPQSDRAKAAKLAVRAFAAIEVKNIELKARNLREAWLSVRAMIKKMYPTLPDLACRFEPADDPLWESVAIHEVRSKVKLSDLLADMASTAGARLMLDSDTVVFRKVDEPGLKVEGRIYILDSAWKNIFENPARFETDMVVDGLKLYGVKISLVEEIDPASGLIVLFAERSALDQLDSLIELSRMGVLRNVRELNLQ